MTEDRIWIDFINPGAGHKSFDSSAKVMKYYPALYLTSIKNYCSLTTFPHCLSKISKRSALMSKNIVMIRKAGYKSLSLEDLFDLSIDRDIF